MGFTTAAFIRRNTPELSKRLEALGYKNYGNPFQITDDSKLITTIDGEYVPYNVPLDDSFIDCGTNEALFLAIAALRDDTDKNQWFTDGVFDGPNDGGQWDTYEEALETGIQEALKLIKV